MRFRGRAAWARQPSPHQTKNITPGPVRTRCWMVTTRLHGVAPTLTLPRCWHGHHDARAAADLPGTGRGSESSGMLITAGTAAFFLPADLLVRARARAACVHLVRAYRRPAAAGTPGQRDRPHHVGRVLSRVTG
jgi:hypothetical protein